MGLKKTLALAGVMALGAGGAQAQDIGFGGSVSLLSDYVASGESQTGRRPALQFTGYAYVPSGFYAGLFLSNVDFTRHFGDYDDAERLEIGLFVGWETTFDNGLSLDLGYEHYFYEPGGDCCGFVYVEASTFVTDQFEIGGRVSLNTESGTWNTRAMASFYPTDEIGIRAMVGRNQRSGLNLDVAGGTFADRGAVTYQNIGIDYYFSDAITASLDFHNSNSSVDTSNVVLGLTYSF